MTLIVLRWVSVAALCAALLRLPYSYYIVLRILVCGVTSFTAYQAQNQRKMGWAFLMGFMAISYNPIFPIHLGRWTWSVINLISIALIVRSIWCVKSGETK